MADFSLSLFLSLSLCLSLSLSIRNINHNLAPIVGVVIQQVTTVQDVIKDVIR